jgi:predicted MFS family arabinose efflux permease
LKRAGHSQIYLLSLLRVNHSAAYLVAPVVSGILSDAMGYKSTFATIGLGAAIIALILFIITPKKIHLPQAALHELEVKV